MTRPAVPPRRGRLAALALSALLALGPGAAPLSQSLSLARLATGGAVVAALVAGPPAAAPAEALSRSGGSGGYSRPGSSRTPSVGSGSGSSSSSSSGGYARPRSGGSDSGGRSSGSSSGSDRDASRGASRSALDDFLSPPPSRTPSTRERADSGSGRSADSVAPRRPRTDPDDPSGYYRDRGYRMPDAYGGRSSFGIFDAITLWFLLDTLTDSSHADFFRDNRDDPGYREWRAEAERMAASDPDLKAKLAALDRELAAAPGDPGRAGQLPADVPGGAGGGGSLGLVIAVILVAVVLWFFISTLRRRSAKGPQGKGGDGVARTKGGDGTALGQAAAILRNKMAGATYTPDFFRVGMPITLDPAPFVLAEGLTKVTPPAALSDSGTVGVDAVGTAADRSGTYHRLYLDDEAAFFQLVLNAEGYPAECRYFRRIDEVQPANRDEWAFWLDKGEGMIGWPDFETKDGQLYQRAWSPGSTKVQPRALEETVETLRGESRRKLATMLYARATGGASPAPETEYLLVTAVQAEAEAYVELHAGVDINPTALSLS
ncbi:DUF2491 family protein [Zavarzinia compransoris]|uniref:DUF2491 domain-containing protein n=1 Tax=Zavarzinia compransoris TaxID=1264899 RepID=A0A317DZ34_9PROT|nr:DUF2491 family protein [Zavarzinia compransoris]PWR19136.1 DUF2491 domain-containing protein [Zavarzinia compransoris]TDP49149.1 uncharacterized protein DUF2491 [Zavarzinia compransoris]